jgi:hypothetical protein
MLSVGCGASLVFPAHDSLKRGKVQLAKRVILITEQRLTGSTNFLPELAAGVRRGELPLNKHRGGDQQRKKDRQ